MIVSTSKTRTTLTLTCDQCGAQATFSGDEPVATPGWSIFIDPKGEAKRVCFDTKAHAVTWLKARLDLG